MDTAQQSSHGSTLLISPTILLFGVVEEHPEATSETSLEIYKCLGSAHNGGRSKRAGNSYAEESAYLR
jgi:hypothetical protein